MPHDTLDWFITPVAQDVYTLDALDNEVLSGQHLYAQVQPIVNGKLLDTPWVFDTVAVLVRQRAGNHLLDMLTCSCGCAGCVGINDDVHLRVLTDTVQWQFPRQEPFLTKLMPSHFSTKDEPFLWTFDAKHYQEALAKLVAALQQLETDNPYTPIALWPDDGAGSRTPAKVAKELQNAQQSFAKRQASIDDDKAYWGVLYHASLNIPVEDAVFEISVQGLLDAASEQLFGYAEEADEAQANARLVWEEEQVGYFRQNPNDIVDLFKSLPWDVLAESGQNYHPNAERLNEWIGSVWPLVDAQLVYDEAPQEQDPALI